MSGFMGMYSWPKFFVVPFSWDIYLLFRHYEPLNFLVCKGAPWRLSKKVIVSGAPEKFAKKCAKKFSDLHQDNLTHFGFSGLEQIFWGCVCLLGWGELKHGRFLKITLTYSRLLSLISQKFNNPRHWKLCLWVVVDFYQRPQKNIKLYFF